MKNSIEKATEQLAKIAKVYGTINYSDTFDAAAKFHVDESALLLYLNSRKGIKFEYGVSVKSDSELEEALA